MMTRKNNRKSVEDDLREKMILISEGCRLRGVNTIDFIAKCIEAHRKGLPAPSLLPEDPVERERMLEALRKLGFSRADKRF
jgi:hypothetical protein